MIDRIKDENILFLDIETVASTHGYNDLNDRHKELWAKKISYLSAKENKSAEDLYEKAAIWAEFGKVVCISVGFLKNSNNKTHLRIRSYYGHNEKALLENFAFLLNNHYHKDKHYLCAHNGKEFDFPYIARRMLVNEIKLPKALAISGKKPWEVKHIDTMELWKFGDYKHYTSLDLLSAILKIPSPKDDIDGSMVNKIYWQENDIPKIAAYCQKDVITICKVFLKLKGNYPKNDMHIEITKPVITN